MDGSGLATLNEVDVAETEHAVASIIEPSMELDHTYVRQDTANIELKRKISDLDDNNSLNIVKSPDRKRPFLIRLYNENNTGPFEVIIQSKERKKLNPFTIGKIIKNHYNEVDYINRSGRNLSVVCKSATTANSLVESQYLQEYNVFVPSIRVHSIGVVYIEPEVTENEIITDTLSEYPIINVQRIKRRVNKILVDTHFVKITFEAQQLPKSIKLHYVKMNVEPYMIPIKQCFRCFAYGHVASSPCNRTRICKNCSEEFHAGECTSPLKCIHCSGEHNCTSKSCPEYIRQKNIKNHMSIMKVDYNTASKIFSRNDRKQIGSQYSLKIPSYAETSISRPVHNNYDIEFPQLPVSVTSPYSQSSHIELKNSFSSLTDLSELNINSQPDIDNTQVKLGYKKPIHKPVSSIKYVANRNPKPVNKPLSKNIIYKSSNPSLSRVEKGSSISPEDAEILKSMLKNKLEEIRVKLQKTVVNTKKDMDEFLLSCIKNNDTAMPNKHLNPGKPVKPGSGTSGSKHITPVSPVKKKIF